MCIACRNRLPQNELLRLAKLEDAIIIDNKRKHSGRGVYVCKNCVTTLNSKSLSKVFKTAVCEENLKSIKEGMIDTKTTK